jgi:hypothetical protein
MNTPPFNYVENFSLTVIFDGTPFTVKNTDPNFNTCVEHLKNQDFESLKDSISIVNSFNKTLYTYENIEIRGNSVYFGGQEVSSFITEKIIDFFYQGLPYEPLVKFFAKLQENPSKRAVDELYTFLQHKHMPIAENGNFLAYKGVGNDYFSIRSGNAVLLKGISYGGKIYNGIGSIIEVVRNYVDDDKNRGCSQGLHVGSYDYANNWRGSTGKLLMVEVNPKDVVSVPLDCECQKLRTCKYKVISEIEAPYPDLVYLNNLDNYNEDEEEYEDYSY